MTKSVSGVLPELLLLLVTLDAYGPAKDEWCIAHVVGSGELEAVPELVRRARIVPCQLGFPPAAAGGPGLGSDVLGYPE